MAATAVVAEVVRSAVLATGRGVGLTMAVPAALKVAVAAKVPVTGGAGDDDEGAADSVAAAERPAVNV